MKTVIVGGVAAGATAAARIRRLDENAEILIFERSGYISYANCGLPYYIGGVIEQEAELTLQTPKAFSARFRIDARVRHEVTAIHPERKTVSVTNLESGREWEEPYDRLLLAPGAKPVVPPLPGLSSQRLFTLRTVEDTLRIRSYIKKNQPRSAVLIGGGFIGVELAENLRRLGLEVTVAEGRSQLLAPFDADMASFLHCEMRKHGVRLALGQTVTGFEETADGLRVLLKDAEPLTADLAILAIGVAPDSRLAAQGGLKTGVRGSILVNDRMETSVPDIYAAGDAVQVTHLISGQETLISLAGPANRQGRIAADNICGRDSRYPGSLGSSVLRVFDLTAASTGLNEAAAAQAGIDADSVILSPMNHAGYYPGGQLMTMKVVFEKHTYRLLGAQIIGYDGADKRIDVIAAAILGGLNAIGLKDLDLAYAPPYSSAKDPVNMAGFLIENLATGTIRQLHADQADTLPKDGSVILLDVRTDEEYAVGRIDGFLHIPLDQLRERLPEIRPGKSVYVLCQSGLRSYIACRILTGRGYECFNLAGGFRLYQAVAGDRAMARSAAPCGMDLA